MNSQLTKPTKGWPLGTYRVEVKLGAKLVTTAKFTIPRSSDEPLDRRARRRIALPAQGSAGSSAARRRRVPPSSHSPQAAVLHCRTSCAM